MEDFLSELTSECHNIDYKEVENEGLYKTISGYSNTDGGCIILGVEDTTKNIVGIQLENGQQERIINKIADSLGIQPNIQLYTIDKKNILKIIVEKSFNPIQYKGKYYKRIGCETREATGSELKKLLLKDLNWDSIQNNYSIDDIDKESVQLFVKLATNRGRLTEEATSYSVEEILKHLDLINNNKLTNAAVLLFGKNPQKLFKKSTVRIGLFKGCTEELIIGDKTISGNLFKQFQEAETAIKSFINVRYEIKDFIRDDIWDYPLVAIREALLNALIHRDYFDNNSDIQIKIFDDHIWFYNPGDLYGGLTIEQLKSNHHPSKARNSLIMDVIYRAGYVEQFGTGIKRMAQACINQGLPVPNFELSNSGFVLQIDKEYNNINERQKKAIRYITSNKYITNSIYQEINNTTRETSKRDLAKLLNLNIVETFSDGRYLKYKFKI